MFQHISWLVYLISLISVTGIYYVVVALLFYRAEITSMLRPKTKPAILVQGADTSIDIMGKCEVNDGEPTNLEELIFGTSEPDEEYQDPESEPVKMVNEQDHLQEEHQQMASEVGTLIKVIREANDSKDTFLLLFRLLAEKYPELHGTSFESMINTQVFDLAKEKLAFSLSQEEINLSWSDK